MKRTARALRVVAIAACGMACGPALAQSAVDWRHEVTPYLWATAIKSETRNGNGPTVRTDMSPSDVFKDLDAGLMVAYETRRGRWGILLDGTYAEVGPSATLSNVVAGIPLSVTGTADVTTTMVAGAVAYRAVEGATALDLI